MIIFFYSFSLMWIITNVKIVGLTRTYPSCLRWYNVFHLVNFLLHPSIFTKFIHVLFNVVMWYAFKVNITYKKGCKLSTKIKVELTFEFLSTLLLKRKKSNITSLKIILNYHTSKKKKHYFHLDIWNQHKFL